MSHKIELKRPDGWPGAYGRTFPGRLSPGRPPKLAFINHGGYVTLAPKKAREPEHLVQVSPVDGGFWMKAPVAVQAGKKEVLLPYASVVVPDTVPVGTYPVHIKYRDAEKQVTEQHEMEHVADLELAYQMTYATIALEIGSMVHEREPSTAGGAPKPELRQEYIDQMWQIVGANDRDFVVDGGRDILGAGKTENEYYVAGKAALMSDFGRDFEQSRDKSAAEAAKIRLLEKLFARLPAALRPQYPKVAGQTAQYVMTEATGHWFKTYNDLIRKTGQRDTGLNAEHNSFLVYDSHDTTTIWLGISRAHVPHRTSADLMTF